MLDVKLLRNRLDEVREKLKHRGEDISGLDDFAGLDRRRRELLQESEQLKNKRNTVS
ncbi:MAG: serine--tRNA ligase, partial [Planifilum fulgidum]